MTDDRLTIEKLYGMVLRETETDSVLEIDGNVYRSISEYVGSLRRQVFDGVENEIRDSLAETVSQLAEMLLRMRLEKGAGQDQDNLLDEEKYILDADEEKRQRLDLVVSATSRGRTRLLEHVSTKHKSRRVTVRFTRDVDALTGSDYRPYGPFEAEDICLLPYDNARALIARGSAVRINWI